MSKSLSSFGLVLTVLGASSVSAEPVHRETPHGQDLLVTTGSTLWQSYDFEGTDGVVIAEQVSATVGSTAVNLRAGSEMVIIRDKHLKACHQRNATYVKGVKFKGWDDCLIDEDMDGKFELVTHKKLGKSGKVEPPVAYSRAVVPRQGGSAYSFIRRLRYLGSNDKTISLSYREFSDGGASPHFTDKLMLPRPKSFPKTYAVRGLQVTLLGLDHRGLRYRIK